MLKELIKIQVSTKEIRFRSGGVPASFTVTVVNYSDQFATFQMDVMAAGIEGQVNQQWYKILPEISSKSPPGDSTQFSIQIVDTPKPGFVGLMNLTVRVFSMELRQEERQLLRLILEAGEGTVPLKVDLPTRNFVANPQDLVEIPVQVYNPGPLTVEAVLQLTGINPAWLSEGIERRLRLSPGARAETSFSCLIPPIHQALSQTYPLIVEAHQVNGVSSQTEGSIAITPAGKIVFQCAPEQQQIPQNARWLPSWKASAAKYQLSFLNESNLTQLVGIEAKAAGVQPKCDFQVTPLQAALNLDETAQLELLISRKRRRWFGLAQNLSFKVTGIISDPQVQFRNETQFIQLRLLPVIPFWMQILSVLGLLGVLWWMSWLNPNNPFWGHKAAVNSVHFNGTGEKVISGSDDQSLLRWRVDGFGNPFINQHAGRVGKTKKAVRVVQYRPVNNDLVAAGLENGEIQLWSVLNPGNQPIQTFFNQKDDRVFDVVFTRDSRTLFSGHGSGLVVQWNLQPNEESNPPTKIREKQVGFAINALALVGPTDDRLAIAGRFNQLVLWNLATDQVRPIAPASGNDGQYVLSLATAEQKPNLLATANNQGTIQIWNLTTCLSGTGACTLVDEWTPDKTINSVAFSSDGCYLASAGGNGQAMLWSLTRKGDRRNQDAAGSKLGDRSPKSLNSVDIIRVKDTILVARGGDDRQVEVYTAKAPNTGCQ